MRPASPLILSAAVAGMALLAGCGTERAATGAAAVSGTPRCGPSAPADAEQESVVLVPEGCGTPAASGTEFEVTNHEAEPFTYTITFEFVDASGGVMDNRRQTVAGVAPGRTVKRRVETDPAKAGPGGDRLRVRVGTVRAVPTDEAPAAAGPCPPSGVRLTADEGDAAMGLRAVGLHLTNCGTAVYRLAGYPDLQLLDEQRTPVTGVRVLHGTDAVSTGLTGPDTAPRPLALEPGESAQAVLAWRNTTGAGTAVNVPYVRVTAKPGAPSVIVTPELDLGTTGKLGVSSWSTRQQTP